MERLRVLQVNKFYWPEIGGVETVVKQYAEASRQDFEVAVLCVHKDFKLTTTKEIINDVKVIRCSSMGTFMSMPLSLSFYFHFFRLYVKYDIFHFHEPFPLASFLSVFLNRNKKIMVTWHSDIIKQKFLKKFVEFFQSNLCKKATIITTTSPNLLNFSGVIAKYPEKVKILPLGIDVPDRIPASREKEYILYLGRLSYYKGINVLLNAYDRSRTNLELVIVGDGNTSIVEDIKKLKGQSKKRIRFINKFVSEDEKQEYLRNCTFLVFPSIEPSEAFGIIQLEAMVNGKPVINTNLPTGVPFVSLDNVTGITVEPLNVEQLAEAIDRLSFDESERRKMGVNAMERVHNRFSNKILMEYLKNMYKQL